MLRFWRMGKERVCARVRMGKDGVGCAACAVAACAVLLLCGGVVAVCVLVAQHARGVCVALRGVLRPVTVLGGVTKVIGATPCTTTLG